MNEVTSGQTNGTGQRWNGGRGVLPTMPQAERRADYRLGYVLHAVAVMRSLLEQHLCVVLPALIKLVRPSFFFYRGVASFVPVCCIKLQSYCKDTVFHDYYCGMRCHSYWY